MPYLNTHGLTQFYEQQGDGSPLVFIHGALADHRSWEPQMAEFASRHLCLRYDLRGHGLTGGSEIAHYSMQMFADDLRALLQALGVERPILCGLSMGGMIAQSYAARYPVSGLLLADTLAAIRLGWVDDLLRRLIFPRWLIVQAIRWLDMERMTRFGMWYSRRTSGRLFFGLGSQTREYAAACLRALPATEVVKVVNAIYGFELQPLERIECPAVVVHGEFEPGFVRRQVAFIAGRIPGARLALIPQAGHLSNLDNPSAFNAELQQLANQVDWPGALSQVGPKESNESLPG